MGPFRRLDVGIRGLAIPLQGTAAAAIAWLIADYLAHDHDPFFAPIAAFIALNAPLGERGQNAVRLVLGVILGIAAGELAVLSLGAQELLPLAAATLVASSAAAALGGSRVMIAQAAAGAILTVTLAEEAGLSRLSDALIGAGVALVFSQLLFSPEPVRFVRRAEKGALQDMASGLDLAARAFEQGDDERAEEAVDRLRDMRDQLAELGRVRHLGARVARRSAVWRRQRRPVVRETENAGHLDLLAGSCLMLARSAMVASPAGRRWLAPVVRALADALAELERDLGKRDVRQHAADRALDVARRLADTAPPSDTALDAAIAMTRSAAADLMTFAGVPADEAVAAVQAGTGEFDIPTPPPSPSITELGRRPRGRR
jgi:hypothetical protein